MGVFRSRFLPDHDMTVKPNDFSIRPVRVDVPTDYSLIEHWFEHVRKQQVGLLPWSCGERTRRPRICPD